MAKPKTAKKSSKAKASKAKSKATKSNTSKASKTAKASKSESNGVANFSAPRRLGVAKTYKMFINGAFVRSERGRYLSLEDAEGNFVTNYAWATRKDFRNAMTAARKAQAAWSKRTAFNRSQILYRMAEMLEDRASLLVSKLYSHAGYSTAEAEAEVEATIDRCFWYAGWADKYHQVCSSVNPVAAPFFNFTVPEPTGVVTIFASKRSPLLGLISSILPVILAGNTCIVIVENQAPTIAIDLAEVIATSDVPGGVINLLTGKRDELISHIAGHMDLNAIAYFGEQGEELAEIQTLAVENVKRVKAFPDPDAATWRNDEMQSLYWIMPFIELKTAWHPIGY